MQTLGHISPSSAVGLFFWPTLPDSETIRAAAREVVYRDEAEAMIKTVSDELASALRQLEDATRERDGWLDMARMMSGSSDFYHGLIVRCGEALGKEAYVSDDGSVQSDVLALKVPEMVEAMCKPKNRFLRAMRILFTGK